MTDEADLESLRFHWGSAYEIWTPGYAGKWCALSRANYQAEQSSSGEVCFVANILSAGTPSELRRLIRADYDERTVPSG